MENTNRQGWEDYAKSSDLRKKGIWISNEIESCQEKKTGRRGEKKKGKLGLLESSGTTKFDSSISPSGLGSGPLKVHMLLMAFYIPFSVLLSSMALTIMGFNVKSKITGECAIWYNISSACDKYGRNKVANPGYCYKTRSTKCSLDNPTPSLLHITHKGFSLSSSLCHKLNHDTPILYIWTYQLRRATNCRRSYSSVYCDWSQSSSKVLNISFMPLPPPPSPVTTALPSSSLLFFDMPTYKCNQRFMWALIP